MESVVAVGAVLPVQYSECRATLVHDARANIIVRLSFILADSKRALSSRRADCDGRSNVIQLIYQKL